MDKTIIERIKKMPYFSDSVLKLMQISDTHNCSADQIIDIIKYDDRLTALLLKMVNSAEYGLRRSVDSIRGAVTLMGYKKIMEIAQEIYTRIYMGKPLDGYGNVNGIWQHSIRCAVAASELAPYSKIPIDKEKAFTAGILHDIGKNVLSEFLGNSASTFINSIDKKVLRDYLEAETSRLGTNHSEVGEMLAREWNLPEYLCQAIKFHHSPSMAPEAYQPYAFIAHLGDVIAMLSSSDQGADALLYCVDNAYKERFELDDVTVFSIVMTVDEEVEKIEKGLNGAGL